MVGADLGVDWCRTDDGFAEGSVEISRAAGRIGYGKHYQNSMNLLCGCSEALVDLMTLNKYLEVETSL